MRDGKLHAVVARSTFPSQNVQSTPVSDHFWKLRCRKSARRCGAKDVSKSKCTNRTIIGPLLEVDMSKKVDAVVVRSTFPSQNVKDTTNHWKYKVFRDFPTFSRTWILILLRLSLFLIFFLLLFSSLTLPISAFPSVHIVGSLTSKLPSTYSGLLSHTRAEFF